MDRDARRASLVGAAALVGWLVVVVAAAVVRRVDARVEAGAASRRHRAARFLALLVAQTTLQQALAFPLPFFARTLVAQLDHGGVPWLHLPFVVVYVAAVVVVAWDPAWAVVLRRPGLSLVVQGFAALVALGVALPMLGLGTATATAIAGGVVGLGVIVAAVVRGTRDRHERGAAAVLAVGTAVLVVLGAPLVPPAPLALGPATFAVDVVDREPVGAATAFVAPAQLVCHTAVRAPLGLRDQLVHVWRHDDVVVARVPLDVAGGVRAEGFRTWSRRRNPAPGHWTCTVQTPRGQVVGVVDGDVRPGAGGPRVPPAPSAR
jgi:hypothetical protein